MLYPKWTTMVSDFDYCVPLPFVSDLRSYIQQWAYHGKTAVGGAGEGGHAHARLFASKQYRDCRKKFSIVYYWKSGPCAQVNLHPRSAPCGENQVVASFATIQKLQGATVRTKLNLNIQCSWATKTIGLSYLAELAQFIFYIAQLARIY